MNKASSVYQEADFVTHFSGTTRIDLCTENPWGAYKLYENKWIFYQLMYLKLQN